MMKDLFRRLRPLAAVAGASLVSLLMYGYSYKASPNLSQLLPFINKLQNPELYPRDMYVASMPSFPSLYPKLVALAVSPEWLAAFHACAYAAVLLLFFWLLRKLALLFFSDELTADIACLLAALSPLVAVLSLLGDDPIIKTSFYQTTLAAPATLAALYLFLTRRYFPALLIAGGLYWINALPANYLAGLLAAGTLAAQDRKKTIAGWVCFAIFATSWFVWKSGLPNVFAPPSADYLQTLYKWYSGHYFALSWSGDKVIRAAGYIALFAMLFRRYAGSTPYAAQLKAFMWAFAAMWAAGFVFADLVPVPLVVMAQLFRSDTLFIVFGVLLCSRHIAALLSGNGEDGDYFLAGILLVVLTELEQPVLLPGAVLLVAARMFYPRAEIMIAAVSAVICAVYAFAVPVYALQNGAGALLCAGLFSCLFFRKDVFKIKRRVILPLALAQCLVVMAERAGTG
ncbi:MAG: hypothetical protein GX410_10515, partial [Elusimicrobia bacterium]|nr:hypothetical protein [Elusimicrobiota bacterium]